MATRYAVANGNWSAVGTWDGGTTLPGSGDDVYADGKTVTIDQNVTVLSLRTTNRGGGTAGGGFTVSGAYTITANGSGLVAGTTTCLTCTNTTGTTVTTVATISSTAATGINFSGTGTLNHTGAVTSTAAAGILMSGTSATLVLNGNLTGGGGADGAALKITGASATATITGDVASTTSNSYTGGIYITANNTVLSVTGKVTGGTGGITLNAGILYYGSSGSSLTVIGQLVGSASHAIYHANALSTAAIFSGPFLCSSAGILPFFIGTNAMLLSPISNNEFRFAKSGGGTSSLYSSDVTSGAPTAANVRSGTVYGGGTLTGTLKVPNPAYVALGVETDNTVGSLAYNSDTAIADALWNKQTSALTTAGSIGERLKNAATVDTTGAQIAAQAL